MTTEAAHGPGSDALSGPVRGRGILEVPGIRLGHAGELTDSRLTGITAVLPPPGSTVGVDVRGGGPATRETDVIAPGTHSYGADAIVLTGGSAFGLGAVSGVVDTLAAARHGVPPPRRAPPTPPPPPPSGAATAWAA